MTKLSAKCKHSEKVQLHGARSIETILCIEEGISMHLFLRKPGVQKRTPLRLRYKTYF